MKNTNEYRYCTMSYDRWYYWIVSFHYSRQKNKNKIKIVDYAISISSSFAWAELFSENLQVSIASSIVKNTDSFPITSINLVTINFSITPILGLINIIYTKTRKIYIRKVVYFQNNINAIYYSFRPSLLICYWLDIEIKK